MSVFVFCLAFDYLTMCFHAFLHACESVCVDLRCSTAADKSHSLCAWRKPHRQRSRLTWCGGVRTEEDGGRDGWWYVSICECVCIGGASVKMWTVVHRHKSCRQDSRRQQGSMEGAWMKRDRGGRYPARGEVREVRQRGTCPQQQRQRRTREDGVSGGASKSIQRHNKGSARENNRGWWTDEGSSSAFSVIPLSSAIYQRGAHSLQYHSLHSTRHCGGECVSACASKTWLV